MLILCLPFLLLPYAATYWFGRIWVRGTLFLLRHLAGLTHRVVGLEHARRGQAIYAAKHQSAWDTLIFALYLNKPAYVLKRELLYLPLFGLFLLKAGHIAVDRTGQSHGAETHAENGQGAPRPAPRYPDLSGGDAGRARPAQALSARRGRPLWRARSAGGPRRAQFRPVLEPAQLHQEARRDHAGIPAGASRRA